ncbi:MAG: 50S ribosomal protein L24 [bacterium]
MLKIKIKKKDTVVVLAGRDRGKKGEVKELRPDKNRLVVTGINIVHKHAKAKQNQPGGIQKVEASLDMSNVALVCPKCSRATRPKSDRLSTGERVRVCRKCGEVIL